MRSSLLRGILNKDGPRQEPRRPFDKVIPISFGIIPPESFNRLPHNGLDGDTRIRHAGSTQASSFHPDLGSSLSLSHVDDAQESLRALQESADAFPNPYLKSAVNSVSALWQTAKSKEEAQAWSQRSLKVLETLADAVGYDPSNIPPRMLKDIRSFEKLLLEIRTAMELPMEQGLAPRLFRLKHRFNSFDKRLSNLQQKFEEACSQRSGSDTLSVSAGASRVPPEPYPHTLESKPFRRLFRSTGLKSRLGRMSSTCADVTSTAMKVLEKLGSSVPILNGVVGGVSAVLDTAKRVKQSKERAQALLQHSATLAEDINHDQSNTPLMHFVSQLSEFRTAMAPITEQGWISRLFRLNRNEDTLDTLDRRLNEVQQRFMVGIVTQIGLTEYSKSSLFAFKRLILIPGYSSGTLCKAVAVLHG